ncbi:lipopolysaccharide-induced tumor necrosis factor-alpha factor homolog [Paramisgurnus dabryanus]|uniref:lipopolysaccharide-induced tumor necrosis factor-alpha factor homolog n=1 Tax=Paramisgurnus dabryanus TaxID=90735 RepID=UPI0031F449B3
MDIPSHFAAVNTTSPHPSYNKNNGLVLSENIPATQPTLHTEGTSPPIYKETSSAPADTFQQSPRRAQANQFSSEAQANPFPVLNVHKITMVNHSEQVFIQQIVRNEAPPVTVVQPQHFAITWGRRPTATVCQYCQKNILTVVKYKPGWAAWCMCLRLSLRGLICGFCFIPLCIKSLQDAHHSCPYCHKHLGTYTQ